MSKQITNIELAEIVTTLLTDRNDPHFTDNDDLGEFMTELADLVCAHCGGEITGRADLFDGQWLIGIRAGRVSSLPTAHPSVWDKYDLGGSLLDDEPPTKGFLFTDSENFNVPILAADSAKALERAKEDFGIKVDLQLVSDAGPSKVYKSPETLYTCMLVEVTD